VTDDWYPRLRSMLEAASPAVLTTHRPDGSAVTSPVWFRWLDGAFEVVIAERDPKLARLERDARCTLLVFETVPPFRGIEASAQAELTPGDVTEVRAAIAGRYLGEQQGRAFAEARRNKPGVLQRLTPVEPKVWDLANVLPS
jgi:hypothetical protein